jgi:hypothetical protein
MPLNSTPSFFFLCSAQLLHCLKPKIAIKLADLPNHSSLAKAIHVQFDSYQKAQQSTVSPCKPIVFCVKQPREWKITARASTKPDNEPT